MRVIRMKENYLSQGHSRLISKTVDHSRFICLKSTMKKSKVMRKLWKRSNSFKQKRK